MTAQPPPLTEVRCPRCRRLLAVRLDDGALEVRVNGRLRAVVKRGTVTCGQCEAEATEAVTVEAGERGRAGVA